MLHLDRSVVITGDHADFYSSLRGLHTIMAWSGLLKVEYARVEYGGQRAQAGRYPLHFHRLGSCSGCVMRGNAVVESQHGGITVHGTHDALARPAATSTRCYHLPASARSMREASY